MNEKRETNPWRRFTTYVARTRREKREWREYKARVKALPSDYRMVMNRIDKFIWNAGGGLDVQTWRVLCDICELFEEAAAAGRPVLSVTGDDVAAFSLNMLEAAQARTWTRQKATQLNSEVHRILRSEGQGGSGDEGQGGDNE
ncbi:MAG: DUF1048 domain-containing protein [Bifidobacteriaceae bacterium]|jgi:DNA-binding ferritin-like protein (Dps family)|nr:DUF1048 domain-containing protein [Bifidobacteriaceae bacterium]